MSISAEQYERIVNFLDAAMSVKDMEAFEKELAGNPEMRKQLDFEQSVRDSFAFTTNKSVKEDIAIGDNNKLIKEMPVIPVTKSNWFSFAIAASFAAIIISVLLLQPKKNIAPLVVKNIDTPDVKKNDSLLITTATIDTSNKIKQLAALYRQYFSVDTIPENYPVYLAEAFTSYQDNDYAAIQKIDLANIPATRGIESRQNILQLGHYYKGIAFLKTNTIPQALSNLQWIEQNADDAKLKIKAQWYLALGYIKKGDVAEAGKLLAIISNNSTYYRYKTMAATLLKALQE
ncbi:hypothetical protein [Ferruginibacter sp. SUN106]|uniref:hypothetical protein n=1 Tax=Ferruginibacter sp. SUN106 TaxID=2978348 RepID=UPI003D36458C